LRGQNAYLSIKVGGRAGRQGIGGYIDEERPGFGRGGSCGGDREAFHQSKPQIDAPQPKWPSSSHFSASILHPFH